jgi:hypothetical protein
LHRISDHGCFSQGITDAQANEMAEKMKFTGDQAKQGAELIKNLYKTFVECDCTMVEINPLAELKDGRVIVCIIPHSSYEWYANQVLYISSLFL